MLSNLLNRPIAVTMVVSVILVLGIVGLRRLPVSLMPEIDIPFITIQVSDNDLPAREMDKTVMRPLRDQLIQVGGLKDIVTESRDGLGRIQLSFDYGSNVNYLFLDVNEKIDRAMSVLPVTERPRVLKARAVDMPVFFLNITSRNPRHDLLELGHFVSEVIVRRLEQLPQIAMTDMTGAVKEEIFIHLDEGRLVQAGLTESAFEAALRSSDIRLGSLTIRDGAYRYNVQFNHSIGSTEAIKEIWLNCNGRLLQVKDVATVQRRAAPPSGIARSDGRPAICLAVIKQTDARMSDLKKGVRQLVEEFETEYPELEFTVTRDQTDLLDYSIRSLLLNIVIAVLLSCLVIFLFMRDLRSPALVALTIPLTLIASMLVFNLLGMTLNVISLSGLLLSVGMMTDNTVILVDNITGRWQREGNLRNAILEGTREIAGPMFSSILTTCAVFLPLVFVRGIGGALFKDQALSITVVLMLSYLITMTVIPVYYQWLYKRYSLFIPHPFVSKISIEKHLLSWDHKIVIWFLNHRYIAWGSVAVSTVLFVLCLIFMPKEQLPEITRTDSILKVDWNKPLDLEENEARVCVLEDMVREASSQTTALIGTQQFLLEHSGRPGLSEAFLYVSFPDERARMKMEKQLGNYLDERYPEARWDIIPTENLFDVLFSHREAPLTAKLQPGNKAEVQISSLRPIIKEIKEALPETINADIAVKKEILFVADPSKMALYGIGHSDLIATISKALNVNRLFTILQDGYSLPVIIGTNKDNLSDILEQVSLEAEGAQIPVSFFFRQVYSEDLQWIVSGMEGNYYPLDINVDSHHAPDAIRRISQIIQAHEDFDVSFTGSFFSNKGMMKDMLLVLIISLILLYLILAAQFESLLQPVIILLEMVIDLSAALLIIWLLGVNINLMTLIGLVVVTGIVINDSILKIDTINRLARSGTSLLEAVLTASSRRIKAILMTSLTTMLAVVPFLFRGNIGSDLQYPLSLVVLVGMAVGTGVSLFVVPSMYYSVYEKRA